MQITLDLAVDEFKALQDLIYENPCRSGCIWDECEEKANKVKGDKRRYEYCYWGCKFHKAQESLQEKIEALSESIMKGD